MLNRVDSGYNSSPSWTCVQGRWVGLRCTISVSQNPVFFCIFGPLPVGQILLAVLVLDSVLFPPSAGTKRGMEFLCRHLHNFECLSSPAPSASWNEKITRSRNPEFFSSRLGLTKRPFVLDPFSFQIQVEIEDFNVQHFSVFHSMQPQMFKKKRILQPRYLADGFFFSLF